MDNFNEHNFYPDEQWQSLSTPVVKTEESNPEFSNDESIVKDKPKRHSKHPVLTIQLTFAVCMLLFLIVLKFLSAPVFDTVMSWYNAEISESVIYNGDFESLDFSSLFATNDEG